jgi:DNA-binding transcriptional LysR family regulator
VPAIARVPKARPKLRFRVHTAESSDLVKELRDKRVDLFVGIKPDGPPDGL